VGRSARVVRHVGPRGLVTRGIPFNHIPAEQREYFVKPAVPVQVGIVEVGIAAVAEPNVRRNQREPWFGVLTNTIPVLVEEGRSDDICLPLARGNLAQILGCAAAQADRGRKAIHQHIVPLVKDGQSPAPIGKTRESERSIDRKSTRLNSSHVSISYAVFCLKKKK